MERKEITDYGVTKLIALRRDERAQIENILFCPYISLVSRSCIKPRKTLNEVVRKEMIDYGVTKIVALKRVEWKGKTHKTNTM